MKKFLAAVLVFMVCCFQTAQIAYAKKNEAPSAIKDKGYIGTLPDLNQSAQKSTPEEAQPAFKYEDGFNDQNDIKPIPRNNPAFINIIMKKDKTSQYLNDLNSIILIIENLQTTIEDQENVQRFNAQAYYLKANVEYFRDKYKNKAEGSYLSFKKVMNLNTQVQAIAQLRKEREMYSPYVTEAQSGNLFSKNNINTQLDYLLSEIKTTLVVLKEDK